MMTRTWISTALFATLTAACSTSVHDPTTAMHASVDRFSAAAGHLQVRSATNGLPGPNAPIDFDHVPGLITRGRGPHGENVRYYNFDVAPPAPANLYRLVRQGETSPVAGQLDIVDALPGDAGYSDFWLVNTVNVPSGYTANAVASLDEITAAGYPVTPTTTLINRPLVPAGSTATLRYGGADASLHQAWYRGQVVDYFDFAEHAVMLANGQVLAIPIYVTFVRNPVTGDPTTGPASGFLTEPGTDQTHNVPSLLPADALYSPLWSVDVYDNANFASVTDLASAHAAHVLATNVANVNCPIVSVQ